MAVNSIINVRCFGTEIGRIGFDEGKQTSYFQYHPDFLQSGNLLRLFPDTGILKRLEQTQVFKRFGGDTFRALPPQFADSLPDMFGNLLFQTWLENTGRSQKQISVLEQLAYVANRGMGALEYYPAKEIKQDSTIDLKEIISVLGQVMRHKNKLAEAKIDSESLYNIFKIGTSAGGARPKILISEEKASGRIIPGDLLVSDAYRHYLVKLALEEENAYEAERIEYAYYRTATDLGIRMMPSKLIEEKHFCTERFDRQGGKKQHILTASGLTGWDFKDPKVSSYENLFELAVFLQLPQTDIEELFKRAVFNVYFRNTDDHLKNHSFIYNQAKDTWRLSPAYDLTFATNPLLNFKKISRALSVNGKRFGIDKEDFLRLADSYTVKNPEGVIKDTLDYMDILQQHLEETEVKRGIIAKVMGRVRAREGN